jgi:hypothetical protein
LILMRASAHRLHFESGGCAAAPFFLLLAQKKEGKEKGTLLTRPTAALRVLSLTGARQLAAAQTRLASDLSGTAMLDALEGKQSRTVQPNLQEPTASPDNALLHKAIESVAITETT